MDERDEKGEIIRGSALLPSDQKRHVWYSVDRHSKEKKRVILWRCLGHAFPGRAVVERRREVFSSWAGPEGKRG